SFFLSGAHRAWKRSGSSECVAPNPPCLHFRATPLGSLAGLPPFSLPTTGDGRHNHPDRRAATAVSAPEGSRGERWFQDPDSADRIATDATHRDSAAAKAGFPP